MKAIGQAGVGALGLFGIGAGVGGLIGGMKGMKNPSEEGYGKTLGFLEGAAKGAMVGGTAGIMGSTLSAGGLSHGFGKGIMAGGKNSADNLIKMNDEVGGKFADPEAMVKSMFNKRAGGEGAGILRKYQTGMSMAGEAAGRAPGAAKEGAGRLFKKVKDDAAQMRKDMGNTGFEPLSKSDVGKLDSEAKTLYEGQLADTKKGKKMIKTAKGGMLAKGAMGLATVGVTGLAVHSVGKSTARSSSGGHPYNAFNHAMNQNTGQYHQNQQEMAQAQGVMVRNPYAVGLRDIDDAYGYNKQPSATPLNQGQAKRAGPNRRLHPGQYNDGGDLLFALHNLR